MFPVRSRHARLIIPEIFLCLLCLFVASSTALAHDPGLSAVEVRILPDRVVAEVSFAPHDWERIQQLEPNLLTLAADQQNLELRPSRRTGIL